MTVSEKERKDAVELSLAYGNKEKYWNKRWDNKGGLKHFTALML